MTNGYLYGIVKVIKSYCLSRFCGGRISMSELIAEQSSEISVEEKIFQSEIEVELTDDILVTEVEESDITSPQPKKILWIVGIVGASVVSLMLTTVPGFLESGKISQNSKCNVANFEISTRTTVDAIDKKISTLTGQPMPVDAYQFFRGEISSCN